MDYAIEYALMCDIYDEMGGGLYRLTPANESGFKDYIATRDTKLGKVGAAASFIFTKILTILRHILSFLPLLIKKIIEKVIKTDPAFRTSIVREAKYRESSRVGTLYGNSIKKSIEKVLSSESKFISIIKTLPSQSNNCSISSDSDVDSLIQYVEDSVDMANKSKDFVEPYKKNESKYDSTSIFLSASKAIESSLEKYKDTTNEIYKEVTAFEERCYDAECANPILKFVNALNKFTRFLQDNFYLELDQQY